MLIALALCKPDVLGVDCQFISHIELKSCNE